MTTPSEDYRLIQLTQGQFAKVSSHRYEELSKVKWHALWCKETQSYYAVHSVSRKPKSPLSIKMHRMILGLELFDPRQGDHRNHDTLDNTDENLRIATQLQQSHNKKKQKNNTSGFKGVSFHRQLGKWRADININGRKKFLGVRGSAESAHRELYAPAALERGGEFTHLG